MHCSGRDNPAALTEMAKIMTTLMQASHQWATRPADELVLLIDMRNHFKRVQSQSLLHYANASAANVTEAVEAARKAKIDDDLELMARELIASCGRQDCASA